MTQNLPSKYIIDIVELWWWRTCSYFFKQCKNTLIPFPTSTNILLFLQVRGISKIEASLPKQRGISLLGPCLLEFMLSIAQLSSFFYSFIQFSFYNVSIFNIILHSIFSFFLNFSFLTRQCIAWTFPLTILKSLKIKYSTVI